MFSAKISLQKTGHLSDISYGESSKASFALSVNEGWKAYVMS